MAFPKNMQQDSEEIFKIEVVKRYSDLGKIEDGAKLLDAVITFECVVWIYLEGSDYPDSKAKVYTEYDKSGKYAPKALARALFKLQQREARLAGIYGKVGLIGVPDGSNADETIASLKRELENPEAAAEES